MDENSNTKDDVRVPEGELGEKIKSQFEDGKDLSMFRILAIP